MERVSDVYFNKVCDRFSSTRTASVRIVLGICHRFLKRKKPDSDNCSFYYVLMHTGKAIYF